MAMTYSILFYSHQLGAVCIGSAWILAVDVAERRRGLRAMAIAGALAGAAPLVDYQAVFAAVPVAVYVVARMWRTMSRGELWRALGVAAIYLLFVSSINFWRGGWGVGPRYITAMLPFLLPAIAAQLEAWKGKT